MKTSTAFSTAPTLADGIPLTWQGRLYAKRSGNLRMKDVPAILPNNFPNPEPWTVTDMQYKKMPVVFTHEQIAKFISEYNKLVAKHKESSDDPELIQARIERERKKLDDIIFMTGYDNGVLSFRKMATSRIIPFVKKNGYEVSKTGRLVSA